MRAILKKSSKQLVLASVLVLASHSTFAQDRTAIAHLFEWKWTDIQKECQFLSDKGFSAVQISPPNEHGVIPFTSNGVAYPWWQRYQPVSFSLNNSRSGNEAQFKAMVDTCKSKNVAIYADVVINHMANTTGTSSGGNAYNVTTLSYPNRNNAAGSAYKLPTDTFLNNYLVSDFNSACIIQGSDYNNNAYNVQNCRLDNLPDLKTSQANVRSKIANYLNYLLRMGVTGFRVDAVKHMPATDVQAIVDQVNAYAASIGQSEPFWYFEIIGASGEPIQPSQYQYISGYRATISEFKYPTFLRERFGKELGRNLADLVVNSVQFGQGWGMLPHNQSVVFLDNHDSQRGHAGARPMTYHWGQTYYLGNAFMLAWPYGYPAVMSSFSFPDVWTNGKDDIRNAYGPPSTSSGATIGPWDNGSTTTPNCGVTYGMGGTAYGPGKWVCEHRNRYVANMVQFRKATLGQPVTNQWANGDQIAFARGNAGFFALNNTDNVLSRSFATGLPAGQYCNVLAGDFTAPNTCSGNNWVTVDSSGYVNVSLTGQTAFAIHKDAKGSSTPSPSDWKRTVVMIEGITQTGQDMFIRGGLDHTFAASQGKACSTTLASSNQCTIPMVHRNTKNVTTNGWKNGDNLLDWGYNNTMQSGQAAGAMGTAADWTTNSWPSSWGATRTVAVDGYGVTPLNTFGPHYWMLDVDMDCSKTINGWFEVKTFISNGPGWEADVNQPGRPWVSGNHFAKCGTLNVFKRGVSNPVVVGSPL